MSRSLTFKNATILASMFISGLVSGCSGAAGSLNPAGAPGTGDQLTTGTSSQNSPNGGSQQPQGDAQKVTGDSCSGQSGQICLGLKYVVYKNSSGVPTASESDVITNVKSINRVYRQCGIQFQVDQYLAVNPVDYRLLYNTANNGELDDIRKTFEDQSTLLVVTIGSWNRNGSLGDTGANAWTSMPGEAYMGVILEKSVATFSNIIGHEIGHYLNLDHENDETNVMNPIIYSQSTEFYSSQCNTMQDAAKKYWSKMMR